MRFQIVFSAAIAVLSCAVHESKGIHRAVHPGQNDSPRPQITLKSNWNVQEMSAVQLQFEKSVLEAFLKKNPSDSAIIVALLDSNLNAMNFSSPVFANADNDYGPSGKLKRYSKSEIRGRSLAKSIRQSPNFMVFHHYRLLCLQLVKRQKSDSLAMANSDSLWTGRYRADEEIVFENPAKFRLLEECHTWGKNSSALFRNTAFAFSFECELNGKVHIQKLW